MRTILNSIGITTTIFMTSIFIPATVFGQQSKEGTVEIERSRILVEDVLSEEEQAALTPLDVFNSLAAGNERFVSSDLTARDHSMQIRESAEAQYPKAIVLSCVDSRVPVEDVFDKGIGDIFVARVAGNFVNDDILGSMEFATKIAGAKLILVLGHENCGAIHAAIDGAELGHITKMLVNIKPAVDISTKSSGPKSSKNRLLVHEVSENNVRINMEKIVKESLILRTMVEDGEIAIKGAVYDMDTGVVNFIK
ncbi:carbonic anhydrase family protein [Maribacter sp. ACAM166]|uniref:carbonic anhydrase family protein n=1 Tax=Maribacter sp. ACAM166 TaxID=2508996 RepID=UPI0010FEE8A3|nr:carbonic anhydrase family protein [Maribacter sp. ACAM166]TLP74119.1 carbonic anhydrase [Maribacter sp. ACAM166]